MTGDQIRERVRADHTLLRNMLEEVESLANRFEQGEAAVAETLRHRGLALYECFASHMDLEDSLLAPALRQSGPAGERIAERLGHEHHEQRELITYLLRRLDRQRAPTLLIARELRNFVDYLRLDMQYEESTMLTEEILHEGLVLDR